MKNSIFAFGFLIAVVFSFPINTQAQFKDARKIFKETESLVKTVQKTIKTVRDFQEEVIGKEMKLTVLNTFDGDAYFMITGDTNVYMLTPRENRTISLGSVRKGETFTKKIIVGFFDDKNQEQKRETFLKFDQKNEEQLLALNDKKLKKV